MCTKTKKQIYVNMGPLRLSFPAAAQLKKKKRRMSSVAVPVLASLLHQSLSPSAETRYCSDSIAVSLLPAGPFLVKCGVCTQICGDS